MSSCSNSNKSNEEIKTVDSLLVVNNANSFKSMESLYSSSSSKFSSTNLQRRNNSKRGPSNNRFVSANQNEIRQRVISAHALRQKNIQNQLTLAQHHISELESENRLLKSLYNKNNFALSRYESSNAELPRLLHSHAEEIRTWQAKCKNLQATNKELIQKAKQKDALLLGITDQNRHLSQLNSDRHLEERHRLTERVSILEQRLVEKDNEYKLLSRRLQLETKNSRTHLLHEASKFREMSNKLEKANAEIKRLSDMVEFKEKHINVDTPSSETSVFRGRDLRRNRSTMYLNGNGATNKIQMPPLESTSTDQGIRTKENRFEQTKGILKVPKIIEKSKYVSCRSVTADIDTDDVDTDVTYSDYEEKELNKDLKALVAIQNGVSKIRNLDDDGEQESLDSQSQGSSISLNDDFENPQTSISQIQAHKQHLEAIQDKLRGGSDSKIEKSHLENGTPDMYQHVIDQEFNKNFTEINKMKNEIRDSILKKEKILETICQEALEPADTYGRGTPIQFSKQKRQNMDPKKKTKLLAALKAIDGSESFEK